MKIVYLLIAIVSCILLIEATGDYKTQCIVVAWGALIMAKLSD